jgi:hypothetical protein
VFDPEQWVTNYPNRAFENRLPDDSFWAAKKIARLTDADIRAVVATGEYTNKDAENWLAEALIGRRDILLRTYFAQVLPLDQFRVQNGRLTFEDLSSRRGLSATGRLSFSWSQLYNRSGKIESLPNAQTAALPPDVLNSEPGTYWLALIRQDDTTKTVTVALRRTGKGHDVVGVERTW